MPRPRLGVLGGLGAAIDAWHSSRGGAALTRRLDTLADRWRMAKLKSGLRTCGRNLSVQWPVLVQGPEYIDVGDDVSLAAYVHIWALAGCGSATG